MIRTFTDDDTGEVVALWREASAQAHPFLSAEFVARVEADFREVFLPLSDEVVMYVDDASGRIDAFMAFTGDLLGALFVRPAAQGQGIGSRMLRIGLRMHPGLELTVYRGNERAVEFYKKHGLAVLGSRLEEASGCEELIMGRPPRG